MKATPLPETIVRKIITWALVGAGVMATLDLGWYVWRFAPGHWLSQDSEDWARFGEYMGGTLGPAFALLAFGAVLFSISEQRRQAGLNELQRLMFSVYEGIKKLLAAKPPKLDTMAAEQFHGVDSLGQLLLTMYRHTVWSTEDAEPIVALAVEVGAGCIRRETGVVQIELVHLVSLLREYERQGGSNAILSFYRDNYRELVCALHVIKALTSDSVHVFFDPDQGIAIAREVKAREDAAARPSE